MVRNSGESIMTYQIFLDYPNLMDLDDWERVNLIRIWVAKNLPWSTEFLRNIIPIATSPLEDIFEIIKQKEIGTGCTGAAEILDRVYNQFGYESYRLGLGDKTIKGFPEGWGHSVNLVRIKWKGTKILVIQDAYLNLTYVNEIGEPLDFIEMLKMLRKGFYNEIKETTIMDVDRILFVTKDFDPLQAFFLLSLPSSRIIRKGKKWKCLILLNTENATRIQDEISKTPRVVEFLKEKKLPIHRLSHFLFASELSSVQVTDKGEKLSKAIRKLVEEYR